MCNWTQGFVISLIAIRLGEVIYVIVWAHYCFITSPVPIWHRALLLWENEPAHDGLPKARHLSTNVRFSIYIYHKPCRKISSWKFSISKFLKIQYIRASINTFWATLREHITPLINAKTLMNMLCVDQILHEGFSKGVHLILPESLCRGGLKK